MVDNITTTTTWTTPLSNLRKM